MSSMPPITIIGAGLSGLTLGLCLKQKGIPAAIYDRASSSPRYNYGIVLRPATYRPLLELLRMDEATFRARTAVDSQLGGTGQLPTSSSIAPKDSFRCHRGRLEELIRQDLTVGWNKKLKDIRFDSDSRAVTAVFEDGEQHQATCLVGCDGPHSITRQCLCPALKLQVLPYVVYNGKRHMPLDRYHDTIHKHLKGNTSAQTLKGNTLLEISVNDVKESQVSISYTYSRPARDGDEALHRSGRSTGQATDIPNEFFTEIASLSDLQLPFGEVFNNEQVQQDRLLHWLMRIVSPDQSEATRLASSNVVLIGDAVHATPILGGDGANLAIQDSIDLADHIATRGISDLKHFLEAKTESWKAAVDDSKKWLENMHISTSSHI